MLVFVFADIRRYLIERLYNYTANGSFFSSNAN